MKNRTRKKKTRNQNHRMKSMPTNSKKDIDNEWINQDVSAERQPGFGAIGGAPQSDLGVGAARGDQAFVSVVVETHDALAKKNENRKPLQFTPPMSWSGQKKKMREKEKELGSIKTGPDQVQKSGPGSAAVIYELFLLPQFNFSNFFYTPVCVCPDALRAG